LPAAVVAGVYLIFYRAGWVFMRRIKNFRFRTVDNHPY